MRISLKIFLCFIIYLFFTGSSQAIHTVSGPDLIKSHSTSTGLFVIRNSDEIELSHGEKVETTVISGPLSGDQSIRTLNCRILQIHLYKQKEDSYNSFRIVFTSINFNRSSLLSILRL